MKNKAIEILEEEEIDIDNLLDAIREEENLTINQYQITPKDIIQYLGGVDEIISELKNNIYEIYTDLNKSLVDFEVKDEKTAFFSDVIEAVVDLDFTLFKPKINVSPDLLFIFLTRTDSGCLILTTDCVVSVKYKNKYIIDSDSCEATIKDKSHLLSKEDEMLMYINLYFELINLKKGGNND